MTAYRSLAGWRGEGPFGAWLTRIAIRIALRQAGKRQPVTWIEPAGTATTDRPDPLDAALAAQSVGRGAADPTRPRWPYGTRARRAARRCGAARALSRGRDARFFGELSLEEIARGTERPLGTVKTQLRRGLLRSAGRCRAGGAR